MEDEAEVVERKKAAAVLEVEAYGRNVESMLSGPGLLAGPRRYVPHGSCMSLFLGVSGFHGRSRGGACSWTRFHYVFKRIWQSKLRFRKGGGSMRAVCDTCVGLK